MKSESTRRPRVILLGNREEKVSDALSAVRPILAAQADIVVEDFENDADLSRVKADFVVVLGGDGSILRSAKQMASNQIPVLGVNLGKLGFLADLSCGEFASVFDDVIAGKHRIVEHLMFECMIVRDGEILMRQLGLNETAILAGHPFSIIDIDVYVDSELVTSYSCDGLIISTPVGSTAHSLSAGGPILRKDLHAFVVSPISAHTLTVRPVVDSADRTYEVAVHEPSQSVAAVVDGTPIHLIGPNDRVRVQRAAQTFKLVEVHGHGYYQTLREKLGWGGRLRGFKEQDDPDVAS